MLLFIMVAWNKCKSSMWALGWDPWMLYPKSHGCKIPTEKKNRYRN